MSDMTSENIPTVSEFVELAQIPQTRPFDFAYEPNAQDRAKIARILDANSVTKLRFEGSLTAQDDGSINLHGTLGASVVQDCVVTLAPVKTRIDTNVQRRFIKDYSLEDTDYQIQPDDDENLDALVDPIDIAQVAIEAIALSLPNYPRADGASLDQATFSEPGVTPLEDKDLRPFASLEALRDKLSH